MITGAQDILVPVENSRRIVERIPGARLVLIEGAPIFFLEQAEALARATGRALRGQRVVGSATDRALDGDLLHLRFVPSVAAPCW